jgi:rfaE bifunctional protein kinase chain/domain
MFHILLSESMDTQRLKALLAKFPALTLLVVGDYFLDHYLEIDALLGETSLETGLEAHQVVRVRFSPGAAGTVTSNLRALGANVIALGVLGDDGNGYELKRALAVTGVDISPLVESGERFTPTYAKPLRDGRELSRLDIKNRVPLPREIEDAIVDRLSAWIQRVDGVIVVDQVQEENCGVITDRVREEISGLARGRIIVAESRERIGLFRRVIVQANAREARGATGLVEVEECGAELCRRNGRPAIVTIGAEGILVFEPAGITHIPAVPVSGPIDTVGAGDSMAAAFTAALCAGASMCEGAQLGNLAAAVTVRQIGTTGTATPRQVLEANREVEI